MITQISNTIFVMLVLSILGLLAQKSKAEELRDYANYGIDNAAGSCALNNAPHVVQSARNRRAKKIKSIHIGNNVKPPSWWNQGEQIYLSIEGGMLVKLKVRNFDQSAVNEVQAILFKDPESGELIYQHALSNEDLVLSGSSKRKLQFVAPSLTKVRGETFLSKRTWQFAFDLEILTMTDEIVGCVTDGRCRAIYSYSYTPVVDYLSNTVALAQQDLQFRIIRNRGLEVKHRRLALKDILITQSDGVVQNCDFKTFSQITAATSTSMYGYRQYSCKYNGLDFFAHGHFSYEDYVGKALIIEAAKTYLYDGSSLELRILPGINYISHQSGYKGSGLELTIRGTSLMPGRTKFYIGDEECEIVQEPKYCPCSKEYTATCTIPEVDDDSFVRPFYIGNHGWDQEVWFDVDCICSAQKIEVEYHPDRRVSVLNAESPYNHLLFKNKKYVSKLLSFFKAPRTGRYRFWLTASQEARLYMNATRPNEKLERANMSVVTGSSRATGLRNLYDLYNEGSGQFDGRSEWLNLTQGEYYHMEMWHDSGSYNEHFTLGVEIENDTPQTNSRYEMQRIRYETEGQTPAFYFKLQWANMSDSDMFSVQFDHFDELGVHTPYEISNLKVSMNWWELKEAIKPYIKTQFNLTSFSLSRSQSTLPDGNLTVDISIWFGRTVEGAALLQPVVSRADGGNTSAVMSEYRQGRGGFVSKSWRMEVYNPLAQAFGSLNDIAHDVAAWKLEDRLVSEVPLYYKKVSVQRRDIYKSLQFVGFEYVFTFTGFRNEVPQMQASNFDIPNAQFYSETLLDYSTNIFLYPAPYNLFYTVSEKPQLTVKVDGHLGACNFQKTWKKGCSFEFETPTPQVLSFQSSEPYTQLTIQGIALDALEYRHIKWAGSYCENIQVTASTITCEVSFVWAGKFRPKINVKGKGNLKVPKNTDIIIEPQFTFSPTEAWNTGRRKFTLSLQRYPKRRRDVQVLIGEHECYRLRKVRGCMSELKCRVPKIPTPGEYPVKMLVKGRETVASKTLTIKQFSGNATLENNYLKGSERQFLKVRCEGVGESLCESSLRLFKVYLENQTTGRRVRMRAKECTYDGASGINEVSVFYPGTNSGVYGLVVEHAHHGEISETQQEVVVGPQISSIGPIEGSLYGGTRVTVSGRNFESGNQVYFNWQKCKIVSLNDTTIECDSPASYKRNVTGDFVESAADVYMRDSDRRLVLCPQGVGCRYEWKEALTPEIYNISLVDGNLTCAGRNFPENIEEIEVKIGGRRQRVRRVNGSQEFTCEILEYSSAEEEMELEVITRRGGRCRVRSGARRIRAPRAKLRGVSLPRASRGGCRMRVFGDNFAPDSDLELVDETGAVICSSLKYLDLKTMECRIPAGDHSRRRCRLRRKKREENEADIECEGQTCTFETNEAATPRVVISHNQGKVGVSDRFMLEGSAYNTTLGDPEVWIGSKKASSTSVVSSTGIEIAFLEGVGFPQEVLPRVTFPNGDEAIVESTANVTIPIGSVTSPGGVISSIRGGEEYTFEGNLVGQDPHLQVKVCGIGCARLPAQETPHKLVCTLPPLHSVSSVRSALHSVAKGNLKRLGAVSLYSSHETEGALVFDGDTSSGFGSQSGCYVGLQTSSLQRMNIQSIRYYVDQDVDSGSFLGAKFEASVDGTAWDTLATITSPLLENWNNVDDACNDFSFKAYRYVRFRPSPEHPSQCGLSELQIFGQVMFSMESEEFSCNAVLYAEGQDGMREVARHNNAITYSVRQTPKIFSTSERYITWRGGQELMIRGENFGTAVENVDVKIDGVTCVVSDLTEVQITCRTGERRSLVSPASFEVKIKERGVAQNNGIMVKYVCYFSDEDCWNGDEAPASGDSLYIPPGLNLVIDVDRVPDMTDAEPDDLPYLAAVVVEGSLIFEPHANSSHNRTFAASYIVVREGNVEIGTAQKPYTSNLEIVLYGNKTDPQLPLFGNKVIGVWEGVLDIHGAQRTHSWVSLNATARINSTEITLNVKASESDWKRGDVVVIASTSFDYTEAEKRVVSRVSSSAHPEPLLKLEFQEPLQHEHYAGISDLGDDEGLAMRAEVGLLSHSVKIRGDDSSNSTKYGGHVMLKGNLVEARISNVEFWNMGQAYQVDRHPLTFTESEHLASSYVSNSSIWDGFNRAVALQASSCLRVEKNVAYNVMGHNFFLQEGSEINNRFYDNLAVATAASYSLLNTDQTPASFWVTHPNNYFRGNHAAGAQMYGFWYDMPEHPSGSSETEEICPEYERMGQFENNTSHSNGRYGLRIYETYVPSTYPCKTRFKTPTENATDPETEAYSVNPPSPALFKSVLAYKNVRSGVIANRFGALQFKDITTADNLQSGVEMTLPGEAPIESGFLEGALIVGMTENCGNQTLYETTKGIVTGQRDSFSFRDIRFRNFNSSKSEIAAIGTCSQCSVTLDGNGFVDTYSVEGLSFRNVTQRLKYHATRLTILHNLDGSLTDGGRESYITAAYTHLMKNCEVNGSLDNSVVCTEPLRKLSFKAFQPNQQTAMIPLKIAVEEEGNTLSTAIAAENYSAMEPQSAYNQWEVAFLVNQTYRLHWGNVIDWSSMTIKRSRMYRLSDPYFLLRFNHTDRRDEFKVSSRHDISNVTLLGENKQTQPFGKHFHYAEQKWFEVLVNARNFDAGLGPESTLTISTVRCSGGCFVEPGSGPLETRKRFWSVASDWDINGIAGKVPIAGDKVIIPGGWNMFYDVPPADAVDLESLSILGRLTFYDPGVGDEGPGKFELRSHLILVEVGELFIGTEDEPYQNEAIITLLGSPSSPRHGYSSSAIAGNKLLFVTGHFSAVGKDILSGGQYSTRLRKSCTPETSVIEVEAGLNWRAGDQIALAPSGYDGTAHQRFKIKSYNNTSGRVEVDGTIKQFHFGASERESEAGFEYDVRAEVAYLTRNIVIQGDGDRWGGQVVVAQWYNSQIETTYAGKMTMKYVELRYMAQYGTLNAAIRLLYSQRNPVTISYCSVHSLEGVGLYSFKATGLSFTHNVVYSSKRNGALIRGSSDVVFSDNLLIANQEREWNAGSSIKDYQVAVDVCMGEVALECKNVQVQRNVVAGGAGVAFTAPSGDCKNEDTTTDSFKDNVAHSVDVGLISGLNTTISSAPYCGLVHSFTAYHCKETGVLSRFNFLSLEANRLVVVDNRIGVELGLANGDNPHGSISLLNSLLVGEHADSVDCNSKADELDKTGIVTSSAFSTTHGLPFSIPNDFHVAGGIATRGKQMLIQNVTFKNFASQKCGGGAPPRAVGLHSNSADLVMPHIFENIKLLNIAKGNLVHLLQADPEWAQLSQCGDFPCTGRNNVLLKFKGEVAPSGGTLSLPNSSDFSIISNNAEVLDQSCEVMAESNSAICGSLDWALVQFESLDSDKLDRSVQPVFVKRENTSFKNKLNSFMDLGRNGFYESQKRMSRFSSLVRTNKQDFFTIDYTGTPPRNQIFELHGLTVPTQFVKFRIDFTEPRAVRVYLKGEQVVQNPLQNGSMALLQGTKCGQNRWDPVNAVLEFTVLGGPDLCSLELKTLQSIQLAMRLQMTLDDFYSNDKELTFLQKLAMQLNISKDRIKIVGVREGSVVLNVVIEQDNSLVDGSSQTTELTVVASSLQAQVNNGTLDLGATLLDFEMTLSTESVSNSPATGQRVSSQSTDLIWPITIMVSSACVMVAAALLLVLFLKKTRVGRSRSKVGVVSEGGELFKRVWPESLDSSVSGMSSSDTSDSKLRQRVVQHEHKIGKSAFSTKVQDI